ncbi:hypothetical protein VP01_480g6 [Puccinia sorghi]|uniref:Helicase ATP-binding domain-containing protein n=1 Tax=Puccinia sorghi TaxID=27349 RepID=A0A0L6UPI7_9BASI|nr:hypothetical protein VP01_480g6 [Puccinia sorghi]
MHLLISTEKFIDLPPKKKPVTLPVEIVDSNNDLLDQYVTSHSRSFSKILQKTYKSKLLFHWFKVKLPLCAQACVIVLVLNPLDSLSVPLPKMTLNYETIKKIKNGDYSFIYLVSQLYIPEVFLTSSLFTELFFSKQFQNRLALIVLDEVHMTSYGHMGSCLMATNQVPLLLLSATCQPIAVESQNSCCNHLTLTFSSDLYTSILQCLFFTHKNFRITNFMKVVNKAFRKKWQEYNPISNYIWHFHSCTGNEDKVENMKDFTDEKCLIFSTKMEVGLGQNLKLKMNGGLALIFMEPTCLKGRNSEADFVEAEVQNNDSKMNALAVTKLCLRVALMLDNKCVIKLLILCSYIPLNANDKLYLKELDREPKEAVKIMEVIQKMDTNKFDEILNSPLDIQKGPSFGPCCFLENVASTLAKELVSQFNLLYLAKLGPLAEFAPSVFFGPAQAKQVVDNINQVYNAGTQPKLGLGLHFSRETKPE